LPKRQRPAGNRFIRFIAFVLFSARFVAAVLPPVVQIFLTVHCEHTHQLGRAVLDLVERTKPTVMQCRG
jgi:hypothetical protein